MNINEIEVTAEEYNNECDCWMEIGTCKCEK